MAGLRCWTLFHTAVQQGCPVTVYTLDGIVVLGIGYTCFLLIPQLLQRASSGFGPIWKSAVDGCKHRVVAQTTAPPREVHTDSACTCRLQYGGNSGVVGGALSLAYLRGRQRFLYSILAATLQLPTYLTSRHRHAKGPA